MKVYKDNVTGTWYTEEEIKKAYIDGADVDVKVTDQMFEDWLWDRIVAARNGMDGLEEIDYDEAVNVMDDAIREEIHFENPAMSESDFLAEYIRRHEAKFGEEFTV